MTWDESKHPRVPAGDSAGGRFTDGGRTPITRRDPHADRDYKESDTEAELQEIADVARKHAGLFPKNHHDMMEWFNTQGRRVELGREERQKNYDRANIIKAAMSGAYNNRQSYAVFIDELIDAGANQIKKSGPNLYLKNADGDQWRLKTKAERDYAELILELLEK